MIVDTYYKNHARRLNAKFRPETLERHDARLRNALATRHERELQRLDPCANCGYGRVMHPVSAILQCPGYRR